MDVCIDALASIYAKFDAGWAAPAVVRLSSLRVLHRECHYQACCEGFKPHPATLATRA